MSNIHGNSSCHDIRIDQPPPEEIFSVGSYENIYEFLVLAPSIGHSFICFCSRYHSAHTFNL